MKVLVLRAAVAALALALGIAIGAGPLQEDHDRRARDLAAQQEKVAGLEAQVAGLTRSEEFSTAFQQGTARRLVGGVLNRRTVAVVALPGADPETVAAFRSLLAAAGAEITADLALSDTLVDPAQRQLVAALTEQIANQDDLAVPDGASGYQRFGSLLARSIGTAKSPEAPYDETALGIVSGFQTADLVGPEATVTRRAALTLVVAGAGTDAGTTAELAALVRAYADRSRVVVAGPSGSTDPEGLLAVLRGPGSRSVLFSTVDSVELPGARISAVLALAARARGTVGSFGGTTAEDGAVPPIR